MNRFEGKHVLVTGGNSGIGLATARAFVREGAQVIITGLNPVTLAGAQAELGPSTLAWVSDARSPAVARTLAGRIAEQGFKLDALFLNAGIARFTPFERVAEELWDDVFATNVKGPYFTIQALLPVIQAGASIVFNGSITAHTGSPMTSVYSASKGALITLIRTLSRELLPKGIRVNVVTPGPVTTPFYLRMGATPQQNMEIEADLKNLIPVQRLGTPDEVASAVLYLASPESAFVVAAELIMDGGMSQI